MAVKIRLRRTGARGKPSYRVVVADSRSPRDGRFIETLGYYDPRTEPPTIKIDEERALHWLSRGAQPTDTAEALLKKSAVFQKFTAAKGGKVQKEPVAAEPAAEEAEVKKETKAKPKRKPSAAKAAPAAKEAKAKPKPKKAAPKRKKPAAPPAEPEPAATEQETAVEPEAAKEEQPSE